ncbi:MULTISPECIES: Coenzyme F420 hydrogenase/dehydrogenase, beta subunit C-terminal domain [unclassified Roseitalea]|uniref:Coenzyme F420 hydrogenase/dehydrogenase, beta subunit C-terminal domain n=1 Tax=unclassified Roseitalea TaxID=2639107 RepID=UPI00273D1BDE|nr:MULTISPECIES: Coenzyme F420 hydrogenase/dehydrogenase, beta subunit C-terminal domain [unclassified Roseitalea]
MLTPDQRPAPHRTLCTDCGISRSSDPKRCGRACQFIAPDYPGLETAVHGRPRNADDKPDEAFFGVHRRMYRARLATPRDGAQWTGITTRLGEAMLESGMVDAVLAVRPDPDDRWKPVPVIVTRSEDMAQCRGMRMGFAPLLSLLEPARAAGHRRIAVIGIPCQVYALRALEAELGFEAVYVVGTPCSDNTTTENFHAFLARLDPAPETICYLEFRADYRVELRYDDGRVREIPFLKLPIADLPADFFPLTCRTCVDYTNALSDITVGYMGGQGDQWLIVRNARGAAILDLLAGEIELSAPGSKGDRTAPVKGFMVNTERAAGGLPLRRMPNFLRGIVSWLQPRTGPRGLEFARARLEMKAIETVLHLRRRRPAAIKHMVPDHVWALVGRYGLHPTEDERPAKSSED